MADVNKVLKNAISKIRPSPEEKKQMKNAMKHIIDTSTPIAKKFNATPMICGSSVKNTWLAGRNEFDLFILFSASVQKAKLKDYGLVVGKEIIKNLKGTYVIAYAEHPYLRGKIKHEGAEYDIDIVPAFNVKNPAKIKSSVDRTPYHVKFVKDNMQLSDEARLLKGFTKGIGVYGADVKTQGFSGYLCELLSINYGRFKNCLKDASTWRAPVVISLNTKIKKEEAFKKFKAPLIVIDPVDPNRNVAAAVSIESFYNFVAGCKDFSKNPSSKYFFPDKAKPYTLSEVSKELRKRGTRWYLIKFKRPDIIDDTLWP
ncbi:MAG: CCA tRNA nucleotidyltransferase, partial [Candidatus Aenigmarchaeota archaeon]|nr:CCA tRNA nucleotidyltransferase [Candidatus Aenigmarchaeota archaeon]